MYTEDKRMTDTLNNISDDDLKRRIFETENLLDQLYGEEYRRSRHPAPKDDSPDFKGGSPC